MKVVEETKEDNKQLAQGSGLPQDRRDPILPTNHQTGSKVGLPSVVDEGGDVRTEPLATNSAPRSAELDWDAALSNLKNVENHSLQFEGKKGHNPHFDRKKRTGPLRARYDKGERTEELHRAMLALNKQDPTV